MFNTYNYLAIMNNQKANDQTAYYQLVLDIVTIS